MKSYYIVVMSFVVLLTGCAYSTTTNTISYHGTDLQNTAEPFTYVAKDVIGTAQTSYTWRGGGNTRNGLIADAFKDLNRQFNLSVNQAFANVAIDLMTTESGLRTPLVFSILSGVSYFPEIFKVTASVRADVIEFNSDQVVKISEDSRNIGQVDNLPPPPEIEEYPYKVGEIVMVNISGSWIEGIITSIQRENNTARIQYKVKNSRTQGEYFFLRDIKYPE